MHTVAVIALQDVVAFDLATPVETFGWARHPDGRPAYRVIVCAETAQVRCGPFTLSSATGRDEVARADTVLVPGRSRAGATAPPVLEALRRSAADGARIASICTGAFTLAEAGLLDGKRATTHWRAAPELARRFPRVAVDPDVLYVDNGAVLTSAGAVAGVDLCLHMIHRDHGAAVATDAARLSVAPLHRTGGQAPYVVRNLPTTSTASLERVLGWIEENAHRSLTIADVAREAGASVRTLTRRFRAETGQSPMDWVTGVRVRQAQELLETTDHQVERIARAVGFPSPSTFRMHFRRLTGLSPQQYRATFTAAGAPTAVPGMGHSSA